MLEERGASRDFIADVSNHQQEIHVLEEILVTMDRETLQYFLLPGEVDEAASAIQTRIQAHQSAIEAYLEVESRRRSKQIEQPRLFEAS